MTLILVIFFDKDLSWEKVLGSGLTRRQTMKRRIEQLAIDPAHNELLHQKLKYERQLKAMFQDLRDD